MSTAEQFHVDEVSPSYWRVTFGNGPVNLLDPDTIDQLGALIARVESDPDLTVVVFRSDKPSPTRYSSLSQPFAGNSVSDLDRPFATLDGWSVRASHPCTMR